MLALLLNGLVRWKVYTLEKQTLSDGCEKCFPKWCHLGGSVC
jgi:hypothetical protein